MGLFDNLKQRFRGNNASEQTDPANIEEPVQIPESVSLSPLPKSISGMQKRANIDRLGMIRADQIGFQQGYGPEQKDFWEYKERRANGHSKADYVEMASHIPEVQERLNNGEPLESLLRDDRLGACATQYFSPEQMIRVERMPDGSYEYADGGRHRIAAAQELGISIPVQVNEYGDKDGYSISPWEKQERFDAIAAYMKERDYIGADKATYEADPEWQQLYKEYDHPVLKEENAEVDNWSRPLDTILQEHYQQEGIESMADSIETFGKNEATTEPPSPSPGQTGSLSDRYQSAYADRIRQTPSLESNRWGGERGESICAPQSEAARQILEARGIDGVQYQNGIPDFSPFSESTVKLGYMTDARHSQGLTAGRDGKDTVYAMSLT